MIWRRFRIRGWETRLCFAACAICDYVCAKGSKCDGHHRCERHLTAG